MVEPKSNNLNLGYPDIMLDGRGVNILGMLTTEAIATFTSNIRNVSATLEREVGWGRGMG